MTSEPDSDDSQTTETASPGETGHDVDARASVAKAIEDDAVSSAFACEIGDMRAMIERLTGDLAIDRGEARHKDATITALHEELQTARAGIDLKLLRPLFNALAKIVDSMDDELASPRLAEPSYGARLLAGFREELVICLENSGLQQLPPSDPREMPPFNPKLHRIVRTIDADEESLHERVASVFGRAYQYEGKVVIPEKVGVYRKLKA